MESTDTTDDPAFPSGDWVGFYQQGNDRFRMDLRLTFADGRVAGAGGDGVGEFSVRGRYDVESREVTFHKFYVRAHDVWYRGFGDGAARGIWGTWEIGAAERSGFHIWPRDVGSGDQARAVVEIDEPVVIGSGPRT